MLFLRSTLSTVLLSLVAASTWTAALSNPALAALLAKRDDDGLLRMSLEPSKNSQLMRNLLIKGGLTKSISTEAEVEEFVAAHFIYDAASLINKTTSAALSSDSVSQQLTVFKTVITEYNSPLQIGTPSQTLRVLFDTGSFNLWLRGGSCSSAACTGAPAFDSKASSTFKSSGSRAKDLQYADGTVVSGVVASDVVGVGNAKVQNFQFTLADNITSDAPDSEKDSDGIVGMSLTPADARLGAYPIFFQSLIDNKAVSNPQFSYYINPGDQDGQVVFGGYDPSLQADPSAPMTYVSVTDSSYFNNVNKLSFTAEGAWALPITSISSSIDGLSFSFSGKAGAIMDTGTSLGVIPSTFLKKLSGVMRAKSDGSGNYIVPCTSKSVSGGPILFFNLGNNVSISLTADDYVVQVPFQTQTGKIVNLCVIGFQDVSDSLNYALIGNTFLKRYLSVFDYKTGNIGFSLAKGRQPLPDNAPSITGAGSNNVQAITAPSKPSAASTIRLGSWAMGAVGLAFVLFI
ncbi:Vacuolar protease A [Phlyctochytrium planicorne]|nr:Vacuolar protease A [Phlyctochytrium planicorne]